MLWIPTGYFAEDSSCKSVTASADCHFDRIWIYLGDKALPTSVRKFLDWVNCGGNIHSKCRWRRSMGWGLGLNRKGEAEHRHVIHLSAASCGCPVISCLPLLLPCLPYREGLDSHTVSQNKPILPHVASVKCGHTSERMTQTTNAGKCWLSKSHTCGSCNFRRSVLLLILNTQNLKSPLLLSIYFLIKEGVQVITGRWTRNWTQSPPTFLLYSLACVSGWSQWTPVYNKLLARYPLRCISPSANALSSSHVHILLPRSFPAFYTRES